MYRPFRFGPPAPASTTVLRPRLLEPLARRFDTRLTTIEAGAGLGKTTLLAHALTENGLAPSGRDVWLTCESADSSASVLLGALGEALGTSGRATAEVLCEVVWAQAPTQVCFVLDDAHLVEPGSSGHAMLDRLLVELPVNGHLLVAGRELPALTSGRLKLHGRAQALTGEDLSLTDAEVDALAANHGVDPEVVRRASGWPALAELQARLGSADARRFAWEEVVAPLPEADRRAFLLLAAVGATDKDALAAAIGVPFDADRLARLPLVAADDAGGLRAHPIWEELLEGHLSADETAAARARLAEVLAAEGDFSAAFELLALAGAWEPAVQILFEACNAYDRGAPYTDQMERWQQLLPAVAADRPELLYLRALTARGADAWSDASTAAFEGAIAGFRERGDLQRELGTAVRASQGAWLRGDTGVLERIDERFTMAIDAGVPLAPVRALNRSLLADLEGRSADALRLAGEARHVEDARLRPIAALARVLAHLADGDAERATVAAEEAARLAAPVVPAAATTWALAAPALVAWLSGDVDAAPPETDSRLHDVPSERFWVLGLEAVIAGHLADGQRARATVAELDRLLPDLGDRDIVAGFRAVAGAAAAMAEGDEDGATRELATALDGRELRPSMAGRALLWFPSLPYLFHDGARAYLDSVPSGPSRARALDACRALRAARDGGPWVVPDVVDDAGALLTVLPSCLAVELLVHLAETDMRRAQASIGVLAERVPGPTRQVLARLAERSKEARALLAAVPIRPPHTVRIEVLGNARLLLDGKPVDDRNWRRQRVRQFVCALVAHRELRRARLGVLLWPDFDEEALAWNLRNTLSYVQGLLEPHRGKGQAPWFVQDEAGVLRLTGGDLLEVDAWELEAELDAAAMAAASGTPSVELDHLLRAVALWRGEYLEDVAGEAWAEPDRERVRRRFVSAAVRAAELLVASGQPERAVAVAEAALAADPWSDAARHVLTTADTDRPEG